MPTKFTGFLAAGLLLSDFLAPVFNSTVSTLFVSGGAIHVIPPSIVNNEGILTEFNSYARWVGRTDTVYPNFLEDWYGSNFFPLLLEQGYLETASSVEGVEEVIYLIKDLSADQEKSLYDKLMTLWNWPEMRQNFIQDLKAYADGYMVFHAPAHLAPDIKARMSFLWEKMFHAASMEQVFKFLAEYEWWSVQGNIFGRAGASITDAMSIVAQIALDVPMRQEFESLDYEVLSNRLEDYVRWRVAQLQEFQRRIGQGAVLTVDSVRAPTGGINLDYNKLNLQTQNAGSGLNFHIDPAMLQQMQNATGFVPVIINVQPMNDLKMFLGLQTPDVAATGSG